MFRKIFTKQQAVVASRVFRASTTTATRTFSAAPPAAVAQPSVKDLLIDLTFVDPSGARRKAKGMIGMYITGCFAHFIELYTYLLTL
jgi:hypothetical protein